MYESSDMIGWKSDHSERPAVLYWMREHMSARMARSRMSGVASSESSHVLCITMVCWPPMKISAEYSSIARFESPTCEVGRRSSGRSGWPRRWAERQEDVGPIGGRPAGDRTCGTYLMTTTWSGCSSSLYRMRLEPTCHRRTTGHAGE
jgi:hypothetical protein